MIQKHHLFNIGPHHRILADAVRDQQSALHCIYGARTRTVSVGNLTDGTVSCPASFQRMMEAIVKGVDGIIVYIDDLLVHLDTHKKQIDILEKLFQWLVQNSIKVNQDKAVFGNKNVSSLGFRLTEKGIIPGRDKLKAIRDVAPPSNVHEVRQFLGLCNFFRNHVKNFAQISAPLTALTRTDNKWKAGPLPTDAMKAFKEMQTILVSEPVMAYPRRNRPYQCIIRGQQSEETRRFRRYPDPD